MTASVSVVAAALLTAVLASAGPASAQTGPRLYAGASIGTFSVSADAVDGASVAAGLFGGVALSKFVDAEIEVSFRPIRSHGHTPARASRSHRRARRERRSSVSA